MHQKKKTLELQEQWELAIERATESKDRTLELGEPKLKDAVGLNLKSRLRSGLGSHGTTNCMTWASC